jgi:hypothetical protein
VSELAAPDEYNSPASTLVRPSLRPSCFLLRSCYAPVTAVGYDEAKHEIGIYQQEHERKENYHERPLPVPLRPLCARPACLCRLRREVQLIQITIPGGQTMNARHLFRYARYMLALLACVGFGSKIN